MEGSEPTNSDGTANNNGNWLGSWLSAAKDKSSKVLEFVKKDLEEFGNAVKTEANLVVSTTGTVLEKTFNLDSPSSTASSMKRSFGSFIDQMSTVLNPSPEDEDAEAILIGQNSNCIPLSHFQRALYELQQQDDTFTAEPEPDIHAQFEAWLQLETMEESKLVKHLNASTVLQKQYEKLVPHPVSHTTFWQRYLFKRALLEDKIARQELKDDRLNQPDDDISIAEPVVEQEPREWSNSFEVPIGGVELTEEQQTKLLEEYESEIKSSKSNSPEHKNTHNFQVPNDPDKRTKTEKENEIKKVDSAVSLSTPSSNSSTDGDWEKISDIAEK